MQKFDKIFAGLVLLAMCGFWVFLSPAAFTSRDSEAKPASIAVEAVPQKTETTKRERTTRRAREDRLSPEQIARLRRRSTDTPPGVREQLMQDLQERGPRPEVGGDVRRDNEAPYRPDVH